MDSRDYHKLFEVLRADFTEIAKRRLEQKHLIECLRNNACLTVHVDKFDDICLWFLRLTRLVAPCSVCVATRAL